MKIFELPPILVIALWSSILGRGMDVTNLVTNGSFEAPPNQTNQPPDWTAAGNSAIQQQLTLDAGRDGRPCAKLECTVYQGDGPDFHVMICQVGKINVRQGQWYRLTFWAKARDVKAGSIEVALTNTRSWENAGLAEAFPAGPQWEPHTFLFQARADLPAASSRLQFWFKGTGTLWLDDVVLAESSEGQQWFPQITTEGVKNFLPNSSFECGSANWGGFTYGLSGWSANLYRLEGNIDGRLAQHGQTSFQIALNSQTSPCYYFDYYEPVKQPVRRVMVANRGWFKVQPGEPLTFSAFLRADTDGVVAQMAINEAPGQLRRKTVTVGTQWHRYEFTWTPAQPFLFIAIGLDLEASNQEAATLWLDSLQLERGEHATAYEPRQPLESFIETSVPGNIFTNWEQGATCLIRAYNNTPIVQKIEGQLTVTDFFDRTVLDRPVMFTVPPGSGAIQAVDRIGLGQRGYLRMNWTQATMVQTLRAAIIDSMDGSAYDSPLGFNHAYPWSFMVRLARQAGVRWWRDWSAKWQTVEPEPGQFDFRIPDIQIQRVLAMNSDVEVLLPFPSATWSTAARPDEVLKAAGNDRYLRTRLPLAYAPKDLNDFGRYAAAVVRHYSKASFGRVTNYQVLNEPVYTDYALPQKFGYTLRDYLGLLEVAHQSMKGANPDCQVVGGISAGLEAGMTRDFITQGGLRFADAVDLHVYDPPRPAESYDDAFVALQELMGKHGGPKPLWITEWGCYADDDPACFPPTVGDATMNRCRWASERAATEHMVKFTAVACAHGLRKLFFHAGTGGTINGPDAGGVLFEYGGAPRKMYPGVAALTKWLGVPDEFIKKMKRADLHVYLFRRQHQIVAVAWCASGQARNVVLAPSVAAYDIMGNPLSACPLVLTDSPVYVVGETISSLGSIAVSFER